MYLMNNRYQWYVELVNSYKRFAHPEMRQRCRLIKLVNNEVVVNVKVDNSKVDN